MYGMVTRHDIIDDSRRSHYVRNDISQSHHHVGRVLAPLAIFIHLSTSCSNFHEYKKYRSVLTSQKYSGEDVPIAVKKNFSSNVMALNKDNVEQIFVNVYAYGEELVIGGIFLPPSSHYTANANSLDFNYEKTLDMNACNLNLETILNELYQLDPNEGPGIAPLMLKKCGFTLAKPLFLLFTASLNLGEFPLLWKSSFLSPQSPSQGIKQIYKITD
ncbi:hypothetical protein JTB14_010516 [Gonioctena quinquepunctata]|nr:hypothetical protein JTB14_010516 [Gonioctena quinquepunctata]